MITKNYQKEIDVVIQSGTSPLFQYFLMDEQKTDITLTSPVSIDDEVVNVSAGHGFVGPITAPGEYMVVRNGDLFFQLKVTGVVSDAISVEMPIDDDFQVSGTTVIRGNINMNIDGAVAPTDFKCLLPSASGAIIPIDLSNIILTMQHGANVPDDGKFGGIAALTKGLYFRKTNSSKTNLGNYQDNHRFADIGADVKYTDSAPSGTHGTTITLDVEDIFGQVIRLDPRKGDCFLSHVRDKVDVVAGMEKLTVSIIGSFTLGE